MSKVICSFLINESIGINQVLLKDSGMMTLENSDGEVEHTTKDLQSMLDKILGIYNSVLEVNFSLVTIIPRGFTPISIGS